MAKQKNSNDSYLHHAGIAIIADCVAQEAPRGTLARKHAGQIALRHARKAQSIHKGRRVQAVLLVGSIVVVLLILIINSGLLVYILGR